LAVEKAGIMILRYFRCSSRPVENTPFPHIRQSRLNGQDESDVEVQTRHIRQEFRRLFINVWLLDEDVVERSGVKHIEFAIL
jgi:hypothetical protein